METNKSIENRKEKIIKWLKDPYNLTLVGIIAFAFAVRLYYFVLTKGQTLWWDEAEYMATAKHWAFGVPYELNPQRPPLFQALAALAFIVGLGENFVRFSFILLPSTVLIFAIYLLGKEMFDKKIGLIAAFLASVSWTLLFWTARVQPDSFSLVFQVLAISFMWKYWKEGKSKLAILSGIFAAIGFMLKVSGLIVPLIFLIFIFIKDRFSAFKNKDYWYFAAAFLMTLVPYFIWAYLTFGNILAFKANYSNAFYQPTPFGWYNINYYYLLTENILFVLFLVGLIIALKFLLYTDILFKDKNKCFNPNIFCILTFIIVSVFYIFYIRGTEDRWVFLWMPFIFFMAGNAVVFISEFTKKYSKWLSIFIILFLLGWIAYNQLNHADSLIKIKQDSYMPVKSAGLWIKDNSDKNDVVLSMSTTQTTYYSERKVVSLNEEHFVNESDFEEYLSKNHPRFLEISVFEKHRDWIIEWVQKNQDKLTPVQAYFADQEKKQPLLIIYEIKI